MDEEIPVVFTVSGKTFELIDGQFTQVGSDEGDGGASASDLRAAQLRVTELERTNSSLTKRARTAEARVAELEYKHQLALELLAVAQLEAEKFATELSREKLVTETLQHELVRITQPLRPDHQGNGATSGGAGSSWGRR